MEVTLMVIVVALLAAILIVGAVLVARLPRAPQEGSGAQHQIAVMEQLATLRQNLDHRLVESRDKAEEQLRQSREEFTRRVGDLTQHMNQRLTDINTQLNAQLAENRKQVGDSSKIMLERLENSGKLFAQITQQFGQLQESGKKLADLGADLAKLNQILTPSMGRGQFGEEQLEELLRNVLPAGAYQMQYGFKDGQRVDAVVRLAHGMVCIDSKFPKPAFDRFITATPETRKASWKEFVKDTRRHIDAIADKYIRSDEGTLDFALMWIPAENIYYQAIIVHDDLDQAESLAQYAREKRVICVSPNTLLAYLNVILIGLRGLQIEKNAQAILAGLSRIGDELDKFTEEFRLVGTHLDRAAGKFDEAQKQLDKVSARIEQASQLGGTTQAEQLKLTAAKD